MSELLRCPHCGASVRADAQWCGQCAAVIPRQPEVLDEEPNLRRTLPEQAALTAPQHYSRWRKSDTSFGPIGRVLCTLFMVAVAGLALWSQNPFAFVPWCLFAMPLVLRSVWARSRVT